MLPKLEEVVEYSPGAVTKNALFYKKMGKDSFKAVRVNVIMSESELERSMENQGENKTIESPRYSWLPPVECETLEGIDHEAVDVMRAEARENDSWIFNCDEVPAQVASAYMRELASNYGAQVIMQGVLGKPVTQTQRRDLKGYEKISKKVTRRKVKQTSKS